MLTQEDLIAFKKELLHELQHLIKNMPTPDRRWIKSYQVRDMLGISAGTLQQLRINGTLPFTKMGGLVLYDYSDIVQLMESRKQHLKNIR